MTSRLATPDPDPELIRKAQNGDRGALKALLTEIGPSVRQWALAHTGDPDSASDLCQEVYLLLLRKLASFRGQARFSTWLFSVTRNQALEELRKKGRHRNKMNRFKSELESRENPVNSGGTSVDRDRMRSLITEFVHHLPPRQREVFQMAELQGLTSKEIGKILQIEPGSVRVALLKARRWLRSRILEHHPEFAEEYLP